MDSARRKGVTLLVFVAAAGVLYSCYWDSVEGLHPANGYTNPCDSAQQAVYSQAISKIISYNCLSCHNSTYAGGNVQLGSYDQVKQYAENGSLMNAILRQPGTNPMPPTLALPGCQTNKLMLWINNNYPQ